MGKLGSNRGVVRLKDQILLACGRHKRTGTTSCVQQVQHAERKLFGENGHANIAYVYYDEIEFYR